MSLLVVGRFANQSKVVLEAFQSVTACFSRFVSARGSIRIAILCFCLAMSAIAVSLGGYSVLGIRHAGDLVARTFDESLMSINYARAAGADFAAMRVASSHVTRQPSARPRLDDEIDKLAKTLSEDVTIAAERSQSARAAKAAAKAKEAANAWVAIHRRRFQADGTGNNEASAREIDDVDQLSNVVNQQIELLVNYTAGDGFLFRQRALAAIKRDLQLNVVALTVALLLSGLFSWLLARRIIGPVAIASKAARSIADGDLNADIPRGSSDELGSLLAAMRKMRDNIRKMVDREVAQRRSAQARLSDALENSREGIVLLDASGQIALVNSRASEFIGCSSQLVHPDPFRVEQVPSDESTGAEITQRKVSRDVEGSASEARLPDGRWLRVSRSPTQEGGVILVYSDITSLKRQEAELHATNLRLDAALSHMSQGLCLYDSEARLQVVNRRFCEIFDLSPELVAPGMTFEEVGLSVAAGSHGGQTVPDLLAEREKILPRHESGNYLQRLNDGRVISIGHRSTSDGGLLVSCEDVTEQQRAQSQITFMARHDDLTRLPNRTLFAERIEHAVAEAGRGSGFAVFCLDLDNFKQINDTLGHPVGDGLLCAVADRLSACVREIDTVARLGGDEFAIIQSDVQNAADAERLARRVVECIGAPYELNGHRVIVGCSVGIALAPGDGMTREMLLKNADMALYRSKAGGRGTWRFFEPAMDASLQSRRALELDLREAMDKDEFTLFYQPIYDLRMDRISGFEALLRWPHPKRGLVPPDQFIPIAEDIGLITPLGEWVLNRACEQAAGWPSELKIAVNVSATQIRDPRFAEVIANALDASTLAPHRLELEITESVLLGNSAETVATLHKLKAQGLSIALDDFGTGYSSLSYLRSFPFDKLKIDQSFVRDATATNGSKLIVRAITSLGKSLGITITAEGVETIEQLDQIRAEGCNEAQGFLFSRPVPATEIASTILNLRGGLARRHLSGAMTG
jgi:diguanylate cyclase (GGDEF)-like protein/PAS domain S-box-containing protein